MERDLEPERVVVVEHPAASIGEDPALGRPAAEGADDLFDVQAGLDGEDDPLRDAEVRPGQDDLVDRLDRLAGTDRADVGDRLAERGKNRPGALDVVRVAADEDRERRVPGALAAARDRGIDHRQAVLLQARREVPAARRGDRRAIDDQRPGARPADDAVLAEQDRLDVRGVRDADHHDVGVGGRGGRVGRHLHAELCQLRGPTRRPVPGGDREAGAGEVRGHRRAHRAEAQERDPLLWFRHGSIVVDGRRPCRRRQGGSFVPLKSGVACGIDTFGSRRRRERAVERARRRGPATHVGWVAVKMTAPPGIPAATCFGLNRPAAAAVPVPTIASTARPRPRSAGWADGEPDEGRAR